METIIQQIAKKLINKILEKAYSGGISDIDALSSAVLGDGGVKLLWSFWLTDPK